MKKKILLYITAAVLLLVYFSTAAAQDKIQEQLSIPFSNPTGAKSVKISWQKGDILVTSYAGQEVQVEIFEQKKSDLPPLIENAGDRKNPGLKLYNMPTGNISVREDDNNIYISNSSRKQEINVNVKIPANVNLKVDSDKEGLVRIENISGEIEAENSNGDLVLNNVSGTILASISNGEIKANIRRLNSTKPSSFVSYSGDVDITLPSNIKASMLLNVKEGDIYSDFNIAMKSAWEKKDSSRRASFNRITKGDINGGGTEVKVTISYGNLIVRKGR